MTSIATWFLILAAGCPGGGGGEESDPTDTADTARADSGESADSGTETDTAPDSETGESSDSETASDTVPDSDTDTGGFGPFHGLDTGIDEAASLKIVGTEEHRSEDAITVAGGSDLDGDGLADLVMNTVDGVLVFAGGSSGLLTFEEATAIRTGAVGAVAGAGDVNADGVPDLIVGVPEFDEPGGLNYTREGKAYLLLGPIEGNAELESASDASFLGPDDNTVESSGSGWSYAGYAVAGAGDVDDDGYDDILIGAYGADYGYAWLFYGPVSGDHDLSDGGDVQFAGNADDSPENVWFNVGYGLKGAGDVNGDGFDDVLVGTTSGLQPAWLFEGPLSGELTDADAAASFGYSPDITEFIGGHITSAGDLDGDGYPDLAFGWPHYPAMPNTDGLVFAVHGPVSGDVDLAGADATLLGAPDDFAGYGLASAGDMDLDGRDDLVVGAPGNGGDGRGRTYLVRGDLRGTSYLSDTDVILRGAYEEHYVGWSVAGAGDADGDRLPDLLVTGPGDDELVENGGAIWLVPGSAFR